MSQKISALRQRMIDDMTVRNMLTLTQKAYVQSGLVQLILSDVY